MGRKAQNVLAANDQRIRKVVREARGKPQKEWRIEGSNLLVLVTQPSGNASFYVYYTNRHGQRRKFKLGAHGSISLHEARSQAIEVLGAVERGEDPANDKAALKEAITFAELLERFLAENFDIKDSTKKVYGYSLRKDALPIIGSLPAQEVTSDHIVEICKRIEATGASTQPDRTKAAIGGVYRWGQRQRLVRNNPVIGLGRRKRTVPRKRTPSDGELASLWAAIEQGAQLSKPMKLIIKLAMLTGQRRSEICGARLNELNLDDATPSWTIPGDENKRGKLIRGRTKNGRSQIIPLSQQAAQLFRQAIDECSDSEHVFPANIQSVKIGKVPRTPFINGDSVSRAMRRLRETAEIDDISIHDMRRAISNWLKDQDVSREVRDLILNHKDPSVTEEHYSSTARMERQVRAAMQAWAAHIWDITGQAPASGDNVVPIARERTSIA